MSMKVKEPDTFSLQTSEKLKITVSLVADLVAEQFPSWADLPIRPVKQSGWDNRTFHLGETMSVRLPSAEGYAPQVQKEQQWLPKLSHDLSFPIPEPLAMGKPSKNYPWNWSIHRWIEGENADILQNEDLPQLALDLTQFLHELHKIDTTDGPLPGTHNFYRGDSPSVYDTETRSAINQLKDIIDVPAATDVWEKAIHSTSNDAPVWIHGDFSPGNILVKGHRLAAVIDFGCMGIGDPACDLVIAWTYFTGESRKIFRMQLGLDADTWARARGWALWKALIILAPLGDKTCLKALKQQQVIKEILNDHELEKHY